MICYRVKIVFLFLGGVLSVFSSIPNDQKAVIIKNITVDSAKQEIRIKCHFSLEEGLLEFLMVNATGLTYESVLKVDENKPSELHFALLLLGFHPLSFIEYEHLSKRDDAVTILRER